MVADDGDIERHLTKISTENSDAPMAGGPGGGAGWKQLKDDKAVGTTTARLARVHSGDSSKRAGSDDAEVAIEMELGGTMPGDAGAGANGADDGASAMSVTAAASERVYKVYKRRWFGLVELVLLNVVASWDVS